MRCIIIVRVKSVPVTTGWRVLRLRTEERPAVWRVAANILNKQSRTAHKGWSAGLGVGRRAHRRSVSCYKIFTQHLWMR